jgi:glucosamine-6-phosphate deaminase
MSGGDFMCSQPIHETTIEQLRVSVYPSNQATGQAAAEEATNTLRQTIREKGFANIIVATGNSQLTFLAALRRMPDIDWSKVKVFHMDEYVGIDPSHPASFPTFLQRELIDIVQPGAFFPVPAPAEGTETACQEYEALLRAFPADLCAMGIGENGHIAFNDPPFADFDDPAWVKVVKLDEVSRRQQVGEGHFASLDEVPTHAVTLTIPALLSAARVLCIVPETRKAAAVHRALTGPIEENCPASILRQQSHVHLYLDRDSAAQAFPELD